MLRLTKRVPKDEVEFYDSQHADYYPEPIMRAISEACGALSAAASPVNDVFAFASEVDYSLRNDQETGDVIVVAYLNRPAHGTATVPGEPTPAPNDDQYEDVVLDG